MTGITVYWFKRDLRLDDNDTLAAAVATGRPVLPVYLLEPSIVADPHTDERHIRFIKESIADLNRRLEPLGTRVLCLEMEAVDALAAIHERHPIAHLVSMRETGVDVTFRRDRSVAAYCANAGIRWTETRYNGIRRGLIDRTPWLEHWEEYVSKPLVQPDLSTATFLTENNLQRLETALRTFATDTSPHHMQKGGRTEAERWMRAFFEDRIHRYSASISKPALSDTGASKVSAYLAWGNVSVRELVRRARSSSLPPKAVFTFLSRLRLQSYFIQKFESHPSTEFTPFLPEYQRFEMPVNEAHIAAWKEGRTGYPLVDACMRCLVETGYLNFRMRSVLFSFYAHHLFQHFRHIGPWLARQFLDFEPGIHYGQLQTQSGFTGSSVVRIFNPTKNAQEYDERAEFIKTWVPELRALPPSLAIEPWRVTPMEEMMYNFRVGDDYPAPIVDIELTRRRAMEAHTRVRTPSS